MSVSERRIARRFILNVPLQLLPIKAPSQAARTVETMNISTRGVYFTTDLPLCQGQLVQVLLQMPKEITGNVVNARRFTGRVAHVDPNGFANGMSGVGVQFLYYGELALQLHEQELESSEARSIQQGLLPKEIPQFPGYEIATAWQSARVVGGDYFDVLPFDADSLGLCIADVAGKGFSAALLMSNLQAAVRGLAAPSLPPNELCLRLNSLLYRNMEGDRFVTFFYAQLDSPARRLSYANAGHSPPIVLHRDGSHHRLLAKKNSASSASSNSCKPIALQLPTKSRIRSSMLWRISIAPTGTMTSPCSSSRFPKSCPGALCRAGRRPSHSSPSSSSLRPLCALRVSALDFSSFFSSTSNFQLSTFPFDLSGCCIFASHR